MNQVKAIYTGAVNRWSEVGGSENQIVRYSRESNSGAYFFFKEHILGDKTTPPIARTSRAPRPWQRR